MPLSGKAATDKLHEAITAAKNGDWEDLNECIFPAAGDGRAGGVYSHSCERSSHRLPSRSSSRSAASASSCAPESERACSTVRRETASAEVSGGRSAMGVAPRRKCGGRSAASAHGGSEGTGGGTMAGRALLCS